MRRLMLLVIALAVASPISAGEPATTNATAELKDGQGKTVGTASFRETPSGVRFTASAQGLPPGLHGIHLHAVGRCDPPSFETAGDHFNPENKQHGLLAKGGPHAGDAKNIEIRPDGSGRLELTNRRITLREGQRSLFDGDGTAIVVHAGPDDQASDPAGKAGDRIACGVVKPAS